MKRLIIVGADGYIGRRLSERIMGKYTFLLLSPIKNSKFIYFNLLDIDNFTYNVINRDDVIIFLAAVSSPDRCEKEFNTVFEINVTNTVKFIERVLRLNAKVIFLSSDTVYGESYGIIFNEDSHKNPYGAYALMKSIVEDEFFGHPNFLIFRLSYVFSFNDRFTAYLYSPNKNELKVIYDPFHRSVVYIEDLIQTILNVSNNWIKYSIINICGESLTSRRDIANYFREIVDRDMKYELKYPGDAFYKIRPKVIHTKSKYINILLKRSPLTIREAMIKELKRINYEN